MAPIHTLTIIDAVPSHTTSEQHAAHTASTPADFDIPPVLRRKQGSVRVQLNPPLEGLTELGGNDGLVGDLYVTDGSLSFFSPTLSKGISIPYPAIALHAVSRQPMRPWQPAEGSGDAAAAAAPLQDVGLSGGPCIYCQIDEAGGEREVGDEEDEANGLLRDLVLSPEDASAIEPIFEALSYCASLYPSELSDDEGPAFADADINGHDVDEAEDAEVGAAARDYLDSLVDWSTVPARGATAQVDRTAEEDPKVFADATDA